MILVKERVGSVEFIAIKDSVLKSTSENGPFISETRQVLENNLQEFEMQLKVTESSVQVDERINSEVFIFFNEPD